jgi:hypothetical protein
MLRGLYNPTNHSLSDGDRWVYLNYLISRDWRLRFNLLFTKKHNIAFYTLKDRLHFVHGDHFPARRALATLRDHEFWDLTKRFCASGMGRAHFQVQIFAYLRESLINRVYISCAFTIL